MAFINQFPYSDFHELNLDWLLKITKDSAARIKELQEEFAKIEVLTEAQINDMISAAIESNNVALYNRMVKLKSEITDEYISYCNALIANLKVYLDNQDIYYDNLAKTYAANSLEQAKAYTDEQVLEYTLMINPINGEYQDVRIVVNDIISYFHSENALTAGEYDALDLTAAAYDAYQLTAFNYDFNGKNLLV